MVLKRVSCLYRVSTKIQLTDDDIPMQRKACADFVKKQGFWKLEKEYIEKGISGYHKSADQRDALVQIKRDAIDKKFDILLVFMFDRLGRREDETPFIVEWLVNQGIEVWSVKEGQQRFDDHTDKLMNYIRYWQSSGESENTSIRVAEKHNQLVRDGKFRGGVAPYGYTLEYSGEFNKKGYERKKLVINEPEAAVVRKIFELSCNVDMGSFRVAIILNEEGILSKTGKRWTVQAIVRMIRNPVYKGDYVSGKVRASRDKKVRSPKETWVHSRELVKDLIIVNEDTWEKANENLAIRDTVSKKSLSTKTQDFLLSGVTYCGYCNAKMHTRTSTLKRQLRRTGEIAVYHSHYYSCPKRLCLGDCTGQFQYGIKRIEAVALKEIHTYLEHIKITDISRLAKNHKTKLLREQATTLKPLEQEIIGLRKEIARLEDEILKCLTGESAFSQAKLSSLISEKSKSLLTLENETNIIKDNANTAIHAIDELITFKKSVISWKKEFNLADAEKQRELIGMVVINVRISRENIDITFKFNLSDIERICGGEIIWHGGAAPACPVGSDCTCGPVGGCCGQNYGCSGLGGFNPLGAVAVIPPTRTNYTPLNHPLKWWNNHHPSR